MDGFDLRPFGGLAGFGGETGDEFGDGTLAAEPPVGGGGGGAVSSSAGGGGGGPGAAVETGGASCVRGGGW